MNERMKFVEKWANFVISHDASEWSAMQAELIDSQIQNAIEVGLTKEQVDYIKKKK